MQRVAIVPRYIIENSPNQVRTAFESIAKLCRDYGITRVTLVVPKKDGWDHKIVAEFLGHAITKALLKGQIVRLTSDVTMTLESGQTFRPSDGYGLLVGAHISTKDMNKLDDSWGAQAIMYLPWSDAEGQEWRATWHPETVGANVQNIPLSTLPKPVEDALRQLTKAVNLGTGLNHPSDRKRAEHTINDLRADGFSFDHAEVRRWAQRNGWSSSAAEDLESIARKRQ